MKILLTGATGYIGKRLLPVLVAKGYTVICGVRDKRRFNPPESIKEHVEAIEIDLLKPESLNSIPKDIDVAYYLVHSMTGNKEYESLELESAKNFRTAIEKTNITHLIYLSGIANAPKLSKHLDSRKQVEDVLSKGSSYHSTTFRAGVIIGSGSASFEIIRDLVEKLPIMVAPKWLETKSQPICIVDVITYLSESPLVTDCYDRSFDIGGPDILTYKEMLLGCAKVRKLKRKILTVPIMTPRLSSYWLYFVTSTSFLLAQSLVEGMKVEVVCANNDIRLIIPTANIAYEEALQRAFLRIESKEVASSWKDSFSSGGLQMSISDFIDVPTFGCFTDHQVQEIDNREKCLQKIWQIGGDHGWYCTDWLWRCRGILDKLFGGVGLLRGRTDPDKIHTGDALDFWRVLYANREEGRLLLFAEMKLPGEAWLEFTVKGNTLYQTATFRPKGVWGRIYWYTIYPLHFFIFPCMVSRLGKGV